MARERNDDGSRDNETWAIIRERALRAMVEKSQSGSFNAVLKRSIQEGIASFVGHQTAVAVEFYLGPSIASKDIVRYTSIMQKMFTLGSKLIEERCAKSCITKIGRAHV